MAASALTSVPAARRRRSALVAAAFAVVMLAVGTLPWVTPVAWVIRFLAAFVLLGGLLAAFVAVGLWRSLRPASARPGGSGGSGGTGASGGGCGGGCQCGASQAGC